MKLFSPVGHRQKVMRATMRDALRLTLACLLSLLSPWACTFHQSPLPNDLMVGSWSAEPAQGTVADGVQTALLRLQLRDPNQIPWPHLTVCLSAADSRVQLLMPPADANTQVSSDANCALRAVTDEQGVLAAQVSMLADIGDANTLVAQVMGFVMQDGGAIPLWAPASIGFVAPVAHAGLRITAAQKTVSAAERFTFSVAMYDGTGQIKQDYTGQVVFNSNDAHASLPDAYTFVPADQGSKSFTASFATTGTQTLDVADSKQPAIHGAALFSVTSGTFSRLGLCLSPNTLIAGAPATLTITAQDSLGNVVADLNSNPNFLVTLDGNTTLTVSETFSAGVARVDLNAAQGSANANSLGVTLAGQAHRLEVTDLDDNISGQLGPIVVLPAAASLLSLSVGQNANAYQSLPATLTLYDTYQNVATNYLGTVLLASTDPQAVFTASADGNSQLQYVANMITTAQTSTYTFNANDQGRHTFGVTLKSVSHPSSNDTSVVASQAQNITVTDANNRMLTANASIVVSASRDFLKLTLSSDGASTVSTLTAGVPYYIGVSEYNKYNFGVSDASLTLNIQTDDPNALISANPITVGPIPGYSNSQILALTTAGNHTIVASSTDPNKPYAGTLNVQVVAGNANAFVFGNLSQSTTSAGFVQSPNMTVIDAYNNIVTSYAGSVSFSTNDPQATLPNTYQFTSSDQGQHTFVSGLVWRTAQSNTYFQAYDGQLRYKTNPLQIIAANPNTLSVSVVGANASAPSQCNSLSATVTVKDAYNNTVSWAASSNATVSLTNPSTAVPIPLIASSFAGGRLSAATSQGVASIGPFAVAKAGTFNLQAQWQNISTSAQVQNIAASTPSIALSTAGTNPSGAVPLTYSTQGVCRAVASLSFATPASSNGNVLLTQAVVSPLQGTDLHNPLLSTSRLFQWDSPSDVGFVQSSILPQASLIDPDTGLVVAQSPIVTSSTINNIPTLVDGVVSMGAQAAISVAALYDLNADGSLDVVLGADSQLRVLYGTSHGTLSTGLSLSDTNSTVVQVAAADLDHDGAPEVVACWNSTTTRTGYVAIYSGAGNPSNGLSNVASFATYCRGLVLTDFNNDGVTDVVTAAADTNTVAFLAYQTANGPALQASLNIAQGFVPNPNAVIAASVYSRGVPDFLITSASSPNMALVAGNPNWAYSGGTATSAGWATFVAPAVVQQAALADLNQDGFIDIVTMGAAGDGNIYIYLNNHTNFSSGYKSLRVSTSQQAPFVLGDINGDGILDVAVGGSSATSAAWYLGSGDGNFLSTRQPLGVRNTSFPLAIADLDNTGTQDVLRADGQYFVSELNPGVRPANTDPRGTLSINPGITAGSSYAAVGDINQDGVADVVVVANTVGGGYTLLLMLGDAQGHFTTSSQSFGASQALYAGVPVVTDFNLDGYNDIVWPEETSSGSVVRYGLGQTSGVPTSFTSVPATSAYLTQQLVVADLDGDGWQDVAMTTASTAASNNFQGGIITLLSNQAAGHFPPTSQVRLTLNQTGILGIAASNANDKTSGNPAVNLLAWGSTSPQATYLNNNGSGSFTAVGINAMSNVSGAVFADVNGDNLADVAYASTNNPNAFFLALGQGNGAFATPQPVNVGPCQPNGIVRLPIPQLNGPSFAVSCAQSGRTRAVYNLNVSTGVSQNSSATFTTIPNSGGGSSMLVAADLNGDGRKDLLSVEPNTFGSQSPALSIAWAGAGNITNGIGTFVGTRAGVLAEAAVYSAQVRLADMDHDGALDAVVLNSNTSTVSYYSGNRDGTFLAAKQTISVTGAADLEVGDFARNGWADILVRGTAGISVVTNANGVLAASTGTTAYLPLTAELSALQMALRDVNHDGFLDVSVLRHNNVMAHYIWMPSANGGSLGTAVLTNLPSSASVTGFVYGDVAHSGDDVIITAGAPVYVLTRDAQNFDYNYSALNISTSAVALADVDHDGALDLVSVTADNTALIVLLGQGNGSFGSAAAAWSVKLPVVSSSAPVLRLVDTNKDGQPDVVLAWPNTALAAWIPGVKSSGWGSVRLYAVGNTIGSMSVGDVTNDGRPDMVLSRTGGVWPPLANANSAATDSVVSIVSR